LIEALGVAEYNFEQKGIDFFLISVDARLILDAVVSTMLNIKYAQNLWQSVSQLAYMS